ncbi:hypothetical protein WD019_02225 [Fictibacillus sp. Mic-4]|uniref:hypothetical protein n=1 Tax=Fictibacillus sp. Mic-4 TaxID=3132826 RepID=UPI003CEE4208
MTKRIPAKDHRNRPLETWNTTTYHSYLTDRNTELFGAPYVPFGKGPLHSRWLAEKGQLKQAQEAYGNAVLKRFIDRCLERHKPTEAFPHINFGFMWSYLRDELPRAASDVAKEVRAKKLAEQAKANEISDEDFDEWI